MQVTRQDMVQILAGIRGATIISMIARTDVTLVGGKSCPLAGLQKVSRVNGMINWNYTNAVNNQRGRECEDGETPETFVAHARQWGKRLHEAISEKKTRLLPFVANKQWTGSDKLSIEELLTIDIENLYLEFKVEKSFEHTYYLNGVEIPEEQVKPHLRPSGPSRQGVENEIILRDYKMTSLQQITLDKMVYDLI